MSDIGGSPGLTIRVPATSANLGPGFDALGLALDLYDEVTVAPADTTVISVTGEGAGEVAIDESHLVVEAIKAAFAEAGAPFRGVRLTCTNVIPHSRGLGSSAAAICAGVHAGFALAGAQASREQVYDLACRLEGHPDNVAPCIFGGVTIAWYGPDERPRVARLQPSPQLRPITFVPQVRTSTKASRGTLPEQVRHRDAAATAARAALLIHGLTSDPAVLLDATEDWLHQPYRLPSLPEQQALVGALRAAGVPAVLSGSGPTVLALARDDAEVGLALQLAGDGICAGMVVSERHIDEFGLRCAPDATGDRPA
jgi:homoserine kinase